jgi:hypothetical protein
VDIAFTSTIDDQDMSSNRTLCLMPRASDGWFKLLYSKPHVSLSLHLCTICHPILVITLRKKIILKRDHSEPAPTNAHQFGWTVTESHPIHDVDVN